MKTLLSKALLLISFMLPFSYNLLQSEMPDDLAPGVTLSQTEQLYYNHIVKSIDNADAGISKLNNSILALQGMSSSKVRHFLNNLCSMPGSFYLEVGSWKGSTFVSALYGNEDSIIDAVTMDDWSETGEGSQVEFLKNCSTYLANRRYKFYATDAFSLDKRSAFNAPMNIYFYDGNHDLLAQELALTYYDDVLSDPFILVVDDWNWQNTQVGTLKALIKLNYTCLYSREFLTKSNEDKANWWNGVFVALVRKNKANRIKFGRPEPENFEMP
jgi:hypothetical protein